MERSGVQLSLVGAGSSTAVEVELFEELLAVLADLLGLHPTTAVNWANNAAGDWNSYAAALVQERTAST